MKLDEQCFCLDAPGGIYEILLSLTPQLFSKSVRTGRNKANTQIIRLVSVLALFVDVGSPSKSSITWRRPEWSDLHFPGPQSQLICLGSPSLIQ